MNTLQQGWESFNTTVLQGVSEIQRDEMKKAFYVGAQYLLATQYNLPEDLSEDACVAILEGIQEEITEYFKSIEFLAS